jgi:pimeloyl-ACP methyl ester carboxylesterase
MTETVGRYADVHGTRTYYESAGEGEDVVVCIHTAGMDSTEWRYNLEPLADQGLRAIALDLPGHGKSSLLPEGPATDLGTYVEFIRDFIGIVGVSNPVLAGCSIGGCITLQFAVRYGSELRAAVAAAASDYNPTIPSAALELGASDAGIPGWSDRAAGYAAASTGDACPEYRRAEIEWKHRLGDSKVAIGDLTGWNAHDVRGLLEQAGCPVTVVLGSEDFYVPLDRVEALRTALGDDNVVVIPDVGHYVMVEWLDYNDFVLDRVFGRARQAVSRKG